MKKSYVFEFKDGDVRIRFHLSDETANRLKEAMGTGCFARRDLEAYFGKSEWLMELLAPEELVRLV